MPMTCEGPRNRLQLKSAVLKNATVSAVPIKTKIWPECARPSGSPSKGIPPLAIQKCHQGCQEWTVAAGSASIKRT
eukprot:scaffold142118_cov15-Tisochrysis_lutea.AAC.1